MRHYARLALGSVSALDTQTVTSGADGSVIGGTARRGFALTGALGSCVTGTSPLFAGAAVNQLYWDQASSSYYLGITGATNTGFTSITIGGTLTLLRASATFGSGTWAWATADVAGNQAYGFGAIKKVVFN